jgi:hypothetical protein
MTFFSVDVEASATTPSMGYLLTVGIVPVVPVGINDKWRLHGERCYVRLLQPWFEAFENPEYTSMPWWREQDPEVRGEAFENDSLVRHEPGVAAQMIVEFVRSIEPDPGQSFFVANPVSFDKPWLDDLFACEGIPSPFHYRSLCLRSMRFGMDPRKGFGGSRDTHPSKVPHHALHDAEAQALDLIDMLSKPAVAA